MTRYVLTDMASSALESWGQLGLVHESGTDAGVTDDPGQRLMGIVDSTTGETIAYAAHADAINIVTGLLLLDHARAEHGEVAVTSAASGAQARCECGWEGPRRQSGEDLSWSRVLDLASDDCVVHERDAFL